MKKYQFYGWEQADVPATSKTYEKIKNPNSKISKRCCDFKLLEKKCREYI